MLEHSRFCHIERWLPTLHLGVWLFHGDLHAEYAAIGCVQDRETESIDFDGFSCGREVSRGERGDRGL